MLLSDFVQSCLKNACWNCVLLTEGSRCNGGQEFQHAFSVFGIAALNGLCKLSILLGKPALRTFQGEHRLIEEGEAVIVMNRRRQIIVFKRVLQTLGYAG